MSPELKQFLLKQFLVEWYAWATQKREKGVEYDTYAFNGKAGLCSSLHYWCNSDATKRNAFHGTRRYTELSLELLELLGKEHRGDYQYPFDKTLGNWWAAMNKSEMHKNPKRLAWVKKMIE